MRSDEEYLQAENFIKTGVPFIITKSDLFSFDTTIPYLSYMLQIPLVKVGVHDIGDYSRETDATYFMRQITLYNPTKRTILWVEDISGVDDKVAFVKHVLEDTKNTNWVVVFTSVRNESLGLPVIEWDTKYSLPDIPMTYVTKVHCNTVIEAPQDLHFRVYANIAFTLTKQFGCVPTSLLEVAGNKLAPLSSVILLAALCIKKGQPVKVITKLPFVRHEQFMYALIEGWKTPVKSVTI